MDQAAGPPLLEVQDVTVRFGVTVALREVALSVEPGEIVVLLGPSGCGKSTLLRAIAGLQPVDAGSMRLDGVDLAGRPPHERGVGLMFQDHALFPHRDVAANVEFGLRMAGVDVGRRAATVEELLDLVGLTGFERRDVATLSGGEAQRVALARALAPGPRLLLLDEPLGSLDRRLRDRLVDELPRVLSDAGVAALHVTHDHDEAFALADRLVVMGAGTVERAGRPFDVWSDPGTAEVARFLGHPNIVAAATISGSAHDGLVVVRADAVTRAEVDGDTGVNPVGERDVETAVLTGEVVATRFRDGLLEVTVRRSETADELRFRLAQEVTVGDRLRLRLDPAKIVAVADSAR